MTTENTQEEVKVETPAEAPVQQTATEAPKSETPVQVEKAEPKKKMVPLDELIKERQRRREAEARLEEVGKEKSSPSDDEVKTIAADLGVDEETAKKLKKHFGPKESSYNELEILQKKFAKRSAELAQDYPDWQEQMSEMTKLFEQDHLVDPRFALSQDPEKYYLKAKLLRRQEPEISRREGAKEAIEKLNQQSMASTESAKNSTPKPTGGPKWTRAKIASLKPSEYDKVRGEILEAARLGQIG
jgi:hypothetical protein